MLGRKNSTQVLQSIWFQCIFHSWARPNFIANKSKRLQISASLNFPTFHGLPLIFALLTITESELKYFQMSWLSLQIVVSLETSDSSINMLRIDEERSDFIAYVSEMRIQTSRCPDERTYIMSLKLNFWTFTEATKTANTKPYTLLCAVVKMSLSSLYFCY